MNAKVKVINDNNKNYNITSFMTHDYCFVNLMVDVSGDVRSEASSCVQCPVTTARAGAEH